MIIYKTSITDLY